MRAGIMSGANQYSLILFSMMCFCASPARADPPISISTGSTSGIYYKAGEALCMFYERERAKTGGRCSVEPTAGSVINIALLRSGKHPFAIIQSDIQFESYLGKGQFAEWGQNGELRSLFSLHPETVTVLVGRKSGISRIEGLKGTRFGHGSVGSGSRIASDQLLRAAGWGKRKFSSLSPAAPIEAGERLCHGSLDAFLVVMGHPADTIKMPIETCGARIIPVVGPAVDALLRDNRYLVRSSIPGGLYANHPLPIRSYGPLAVVAATTRTSPDAVYHLVRALFENLAEFKKQNPTFADLNPWDMVRAGLTAPLHDGAVRYYREKGWIK